MVFSYKFLLVLNFFLIVDRNQTDLHRSEPSSRISLINEQLNPLKRLHFKVEMNRHRGVNHSFR